MKNDVTDEDISERAALTGAIDKLVALFREFGCNENEDPGLWLRGLTAENERLLKALKLIASCKCQTNLLNCGCVICIAEKAIRD